MLRSELLDYKGHAAVAEGRESAICDILKTMQEELNLKSNRICDLEENYQKCNQDLQEVKEYNEELAKEYKKLNNQYNKIYGSCKSLLEFKKQTTNTLQIAKKTEAEAKEREDQYVDRIQQLEQQMDSLLVDKRKVIYKYIDRS